MPSSSGPRRSHRLSVSRKTEVQARSQASTSAMAPRKAVVRTFAGSSFEGRHEGIKIVPMDQTVDTSVDLRKILRDIVREPIKTLVPPWSWKAAAFAAVVRGAAFFVTNLQAGRGEATKALAVEAVFALVTGGLIGAISQQLRNAEPLWATAAVVWIALPGLMLLAQSGVHRLAQTPHLSGGLVLSFLVSGVSAAFSWYAMRHGAMLGGSHETTILHDIEVLPKILLNFLLAGPRMVASALRAKDYG